MPLFRQIQPEAINRETAWAHPRLSFRRGRNPKTQGLGSYKLVRLLVTLTTTFLLSSCAHLGLTSDSEDPTSAPSLEYSLAAEKSISPEGIGANGYDLVTMLESQGKEVVAGSRDYAATHDGVTYFFTNAENRQTFLDSPARYTPKYGGFCGWGMVDYRDTSDQERHLNIPHATPTPPVSDGGVYAVFGRNKNARIIGFYNQTVYERFLVDPALYELTADLTWNERRDDALVPWNAVSEHVRSLKEDQK